jgi:hypothetical protein
LREMASSMSNWLRSACGGGGSEEEGYVRLTAAWRAVAASHYFVMCQIETLSDTKTPQWKSHN